jgi:hypothetical protein
MWKRKFHSTHSHIFFMVVWNLVHHTERKTETGGVTKEAADEDIRTDGAVTNRGL